MCGNFFTKDAKIKEDISCNFFIFEVGDRHFGGPQVHDGKLVAYAGPLSLSIQLEGVFEVKSRILIFKQFSFILVDVVYKQDRY